MKSLSLKQMLIIYVPSVSILVLVAIVHIHFKVSMYDIFRDPTVIGKVHPLSGVLSNLGILLWWSTTSLCLFTAMLLLKLNQSKKFWFLLSSGLLSAWLTLDDLFEFHEAADWYFGLTQGILIKSLAVVVFAYLIGFRHTILRTNFLILLMALGLLSTSDVVDHFQEGSLLSSLGEWRIFIEDGSKWLGIACWCGYFTHTAYWMLYDTFKSSLQHKL
jgi:hypothetical protein